jgi:hypothetical protein
MSDLQLTRKDIPILPNTTTLTQQHNKTNSMEQGFSQKSQCLLAQLVKQFPMHDGAKRSVTVGLRVLTVVIFSWSIVLCSSVEVHQHCLHPESQTVSHARSRKETEALLLLACVLSGSFFHPGCMFL